MTDPRLLHDTAVDLLRAREERDAWRTWADYHYPWSLFASVRPDDAEIRDELGSVLGDVRSELSKALARCARLESELAEAKEPPKRERLTTKALQRMSEAELKAIDVGSLDTEEQRLLLAFYKYLGDICGGGR